MKHLLSSFALCVFAQLAHAAVPFDEIQRYDVDKNGVLDQAELDLLARIKTRMSGTQRSFFDPALNSKSTLPVATLRQTEIVNPCEPEKRFFLQNEVTELSLLIPDHVVGGKSATISITDDKLGGVTSWKLKGALAFLPRIGGRCLTGDSKRGKPYAVLGGYAVAPYLSFEGQGSSGGASVSDLRFGVLGQFQFFGGPLRHQTLSLRAFARTDFDGDAEIYGLGASWKPYITDWGLNVRRTGTKPTNFWWTLQADVEYQKVKKAGQSGLTAGQDYGWVSIKTGVKYELPTDPGTFFASADYTVAYDVINDVPANIAEARFGVYLDPKKRNSLEVIYAKGRNRNSLALVDQVTFNLGFSF